MTVRYGNIMNDSRIRRLYLRSKIFEKSFMWGYMQHSACTDVEVVVWVPVFPVAYYPLR